MTAAFTGRFRASSVSVVSRVRIIALFPDRVLEELSVAGFAAFEGMEPTSSITSKFQGILPTRRNDT
jgi:hypothetical protein